MADERDRSVKEFIEATEGTLRNEPQTVFDDRLLRQSLSILGPREPILIEPEAFVAEAIIAMQSSRIGCVLVAKGGKLEGIFTERDVLTRVVGTGVDPASTSMRAVMTANPEYLRASDSIAYALNAMSVGGYRHVPLVNDAREPVGVVSVTDVVDYIVRLFPKSVMNLPTLPRQNYAREREGP